MAYLTTWISPSGVHLSLRRIMPPDAQHLGAFVAGLSPAARYQRFHGDRRKLSAREASYLADVDFFLHHAFIVCALHDGNERMVAEARCAALVEEPQCMEYAVAVADPWQRQGIGRRCLQLLICAATRSGFSELRGQVLPSNHAMLALAKSLGFDCKPIGGQFSTTRLFLRAEAVTALSETPAAPQVAAVSNL